MNGKRERLPYNVPYERSEIRDQRSAVERIVGQAFLPAEPMNVGKRERLPYKNSL